MGDMLYVKTGDGATRELDIETTKTIIQNADVRNTAVNLGTVTGTVELDLASACIFQMTLGGAVTLNTSVTIPGLTIVIVIVNPSSYAVTWGMTPKWSNGAAPTLSNKTDMVTLMCDASSTWRGVQVAAAMA